MTLSDERLDELEQFWSCRLIMPWTSPDGEPKPPTAQENDYLISAARRIKEVEAERDALLCLADETDATAKNLAADNARLREAVEMASGYVLNRGQRLTPTDRQRLYRLLQEALAPTPEDSLAAHDAAVRDRALEEAANICIGYIEEPISPMPSDNSKAIMNAIRALKTEPDND